MRFNSLYIIILLAVFCSCENGEDPTGAKNLIAKELDVVVDIPDVEINLSHLKFERQGGVYMLGDQLFSGYVVDYYPNGELKSRFALKDGQKVGKAEEFFIDGHLKSLCNYHENRLHGEKKNWAGSKSHHLMASRNYYEGLAHGKHVKWYESGQVFKIMHYNMGKEDGLQQAFLENGTLYANYEARNGRSFGLKKSMLCVELKDEELIK